MTKNCEVCGKGFETRSAKARWCEAHRPNRSEYYKLWKLANAEEQKAKAHAYYEANKDDFSAASREYYQQNREAIIDREKLRYYANPERGKKRAKQWALENKERRRAIAKKWDQANPESNRAACKRFREKHREYNLTRLREWREANAEKVAKYNLEHATETAERGRKWREEHPDRVRAQAAARRARIRGNGGTFTENDVLCLYDEQCGLCASCRVELNRKFEIDHIMPIFLGGSNWPENLQLLCKKCNRSKGHKHPEKWTAKIVTAQ